jgi:hypothetical protein
MEIITKILSLTFLAVCGVTAGVIYLADFKFSPSLLEESISNSDKYEADRSMDLSAYKKHLLDNYVEQQPSRDIPEKQKSLWTDTYDKPESSGYSRSQEAKRLAEENSLSALQGKMRYWYNQYHRALQSGQTQKANDAYIQYGNYKEALEIKRGL